MGKGRDKKKKNRVNAGVKKAHNQGRREELNEGKRERREERKAKGGEDDIQALLAQVALQDKQIKGCTIKENAEPPSPRCNCTFTALASQQAAGVRNKHDVLLYGGEFFDGRKTFVYGDLYKYDVKKSSWTQIITKKPPKPRSGHQSFAYKGQFYVFGGEYTSPNQKNFNHYRDLWRLDLETWEWDKLSLKGGPSARSGHRMVVVKGKAILFGGFYDTGKELKYYADLWVFDIVNMKWTSHGQPGQSCPSKRSGFQFFADEEKNRVYLYGGYSKKVDDNGDEHGVTHDDLWCLDLNTMLWERVKKSGIVPSKRAGCTIVTHKRNAICFGGVVDHEVKDGDSMVSEFFNDIFHFSLDKRRWFPVTICPAGSKTAIMGQTHVVQRGGSGSGTATKEEKAATRIQAHFRGYSVRKAYKTYKIGGKVNELLYSPAVIKGSNAKIVLPRPRIKGSMVVIDNVLWLYGGSFETDEEEVTMDDMWKLSLNKSSTWTCINPGTYKVPENSSDEEMDTDEEMMMEDMSDMSDSDFSDMSD